MCPRRGILLLGKADVTFTEGMVRVAEGFEICGVLILVAGLFWTFGRGVSALRSQGTTRVAYRTVRESFEVTLLLGIEVLVAADLIRTIAVAPTLENVAGLGLIVLIRTFLSFSLEIEIEGVPPWRRAIVSGGTRIRRPDGDQ
jgi:uncharacterized membrane protein